jgi:hypothetical protein
MGAHSLKTTAPDVNPLTDIESIVMDAQHEANIPALLELLEQMDGLPDWKVRPHHFRHLDSSYTEKYVSLQ